MSAVRSANARARTGSQSRSGTGDGRSITPSPTVPRTSIRSSSSACVTFPSRADGRRRRCTTPWPSTSPTQPLHRRRALRLPARGGVRLVELPGSSAVHGVHHRRGHGAGRRRRPAGRRAQHERRRLAARRRSATEIELHLMRWFASELFGLPPGAGGMLTSGGAMANFVALKAARDHQAGLGRAPRGRGGRPAARALPVDEIHVVSLRARRHAGPGHRPGAVRSPSTMASASAWTRCARRSRRDRAAGRRPFAVVATAGTVATGAVDPLPEIADLCAAEGLWFHVDAAYGGPAVLADDLRPLFAGIERADSIAFDPHKWMYTPHVGGCVLVRDMRHLADSFDADASYVSRTRSARATGSTWACSARSSAAVPGAEDLGVAAGARAARLRAPHLARRRARPLPGRAGRGARRTSSWRRRSALSICCFRYVPPDSARRPAPAGGLPGRAERAAHDRDPARRPGLLLQRGAGGAVRASRCIVNFRTEAEDVDAVLDVAAELGAAIDAELRPEALR